MATTKPNNGMSVKTYRGDAKTLLGLNLPKAKTRNLAGFTIRVAPDGQRNCRRHSIRYLELVSDIKCTTNL